MPTSVLYAVGRSLVAIAASSKLLSSEAPALGDAAAVGALAVPVAGGGAGSEEEDDDCCGFLALGDGAAVAPGPASAISSML